MMPKALTPDTRLSIIGLGYVGLPLAIAWSRHFKVLGFDPDPTRIEELRAGQDRRREARAEDLTPGPTLHFTSDPESLRQSDAFIVAVPTPIDEIKRPDLTALRTACVTVGSRLGPGSAVIFESTVYPGATEEIAVPLLEEHSGLRLNQDFVVGYSPERVNPGDLSHPFTEIIKITSASSPEALEWVDGLYRRIVRAGTHPVASIRIAEAAKVIENSQRDLNIAFMNELALLFSHLGLDTQDVLEAAGTKWNFLPFRPGFVGGHCIGVDPYYLTHKAQQAGYQPEVILAGRRINDSMGRWVATRVVKLMLKKGIALPQATVLIQGFTFKENCADIRNTRVAELVSELRSYGVAVEITDPWAHPDEVREEYGWTLVNPGPQARYDALILAVAHREFATQTKADLARLVRNPHVIFDVKSVLPRDGVDARL
jgi:UDP-N-acetyl-D-galactosamine dehydrogenase